MKRINPNILLYISFLLIYVGLFSQNLSLYEKHVFISGKDTLVYRLLSPKDYNLKKSYPLHLFLHGVGERGNDNEKQLVHGSKLFLKKHNRKKFKSWVVFPQCDLESQWADMSFNPDDKESLFKNNNGLDTSNSLNLVIKLMDSLVDLNNVNENKVYVSGLSMGGMGTFEILFRRPSMFAAATPICGDGRIETVPFFAKQTPVWIFHGSDDRVVHPKYSLKMANAIIENGGSPKITFYENVGHDSWNNAFEEIDFLKWIHSKSKK